MKILLTGAHFTPAQAVIEELSSFSDVEIVYVGRSKTREGDQVRSVESVVFPQKGVKFYSIIAGRFQTTNSAYFFTSTLKIPIGFIHAFYILLKEKPDIILSFGGYVGLPMVIAGWFLSIPIIIHEQTLVSGLANSISSLFASKIALAFTETAKNFPEKKVVITGNPLRTEILTPSLSPPKALKIFFQNAKIENLPILLIVGGNQGSHLLNKTIEEILDKLLGNFYIVHQTGESKFRDFETLLDIKSKLNYSKRYFVSKWFDDKVYSHILKNTDIALSRGGINTLCEFAYFGIPTLVVPIPFLYKNEQLKNAVFFAKFHFVKIIEQKFLHSSKLMQELSLMKKNLNKIKKDAKDAKRFIAKDGAKKLALEVMILLKNSV
ncbi:glycosyltransferase [Candidatus Daviesbacteria bacterium]|nr:glycosyltransferase [Candidatus Daviesbacteria bacterium]